jgi:hypothetical protein
MKIIKHHSILLFLLCANYFYAISQTKSDSTIHDNSRQIDIVVNDSCVGPINNKTRFNQNVLKKLFPNLIVKKAISSTEGEEFPIFKIMNKSTVLLVINPDSDRNTIYSVEIKSEEVKNELGPQIGFTHSQTFKDKSSANCEPGMEESSGFVFCQDAKSKHITYLFSGEYSGSDSELPPPKILGSWKIKEIIWKP